MNGILCTPPVATVSMSVQCLDMSADRVLASGKARKYAVLQACPAPAGVQPRLEAGGRTEALGLRGCQRVAAGGSPESKQVVPQHVHMPYTQLRHYRRNGKHVP